MTDARGLPAGEKFYRSQIFSGSVFVAALLLFAFLWFFMVHSVRIKELRYRLKAANDQNTSVRTMSLVSRYKLLRESATENDPGATYAREGRVMQILAETAYLNDAEEFNFAERAAKLTVDFFDLISGMPPYKHERSSKENRILERAFYHEITRSYKDAIAQYDVALGLRSAPDTRAYAMLHRGFCQAVGGSRTKAVGDFKEVIRTATDEEYIETAKALLAMLSEIESALKEVDAMPASVQKAAAYYNLTAYDQAITTLKAVPAAQNNSEALYYLARAQEETGQAKQAADNYRKAIKMNAAAPWAVKANRRIFALGAFYAAGKEYRIESKANVEKGIIQDAELLKDARRFEKVSERIEEGEKKTVAAYLGEPAPEVKTALAPTATPPAPVPAAKTAPAVAANSAEVNPPQTAVAPPAAPAAPAPPDEKGKNVSGPDWAKLEKLPRAEKIAYIHRHKRVESVMLENGNQFSGLKISENKEKLILFTALGRVVILKSDIETRETVAP
ncbi:MAG: tetratricopeptide repeat protein [Turneriella sp.]|nr:tetratricopeptide repeat protein [Turneriella sp.]